MNKTNFKIIIIAIISCVLIACGSGGGATDSASPATTGISVAIAESNLIADPNKPIIIESNLIADPNKPKININVISHALYKPDEYETYETGESFTIKATLVESATITTENKIKLVTNNTGLIYESNECIINGSGYCDINVTIAESANLGESSLFITSNTGLVGTTQLNFKVIAGNIILFTDKDQRKGDFAVGYSSANQAADAWCKSYVESKATLSDRYRKKHYKGMIDGNPATISGKVYYRDDAKIKVATATGGYLAESLDNSVTLTSGIVLAWTGGGDKDIVKGTAGVHDCQKWSLTVPAVPNSGQLFGRGGVADIVDKGEFVDFGGFGIYTKGWLDGGIMICTNAQGIYCVSQ